MPRFNTKPPFTELEIVLKPMRKNQVSGAFMQGKYLKFHNGTLETQNKEEIAALRKHPGYGAYIWEEAEAPQEAE